MFVFELHAQRLTSLQFSFLRQNNLNLAQLFPYYVSTIIFLMPYLTAIFWYGMDISSQTQEVDNGGTIAEPLSGDHKGGDVADLTDVTLTQSCIYVCAMPCIVCIQISDFIVALRRAYQSYYEEAENERTTEESRRAARKHNKRSFIRRVYRTLARWFQGRRSVSLIFIFRPARKYREFRSLQALLINSFSSYSLLFDYFIMQQERDSSY
jgi:hypothetical protein